MSTTNADKHGRLSEPGEYDDGMQTLLQIMWGDGYLSPGGAAEVARLLEGCDISGCTILDIGCGLGAIDQLLVDEYHAASVLGIDVDPSLLARMQERIERALMTDRIQGLQVGSGPLPFADGSFDVVFSKGARRRCVRPDSTMSRFAIGMTGISIWLSASWRPCRVRCTR
jgi:SAM-dependent methyltransferase